MNTKDEKNLLNTLELSDNQLANVVGGSTDPIRTEGGWRLCEGYGYEFCGELKASYVDSAKACGNCIHFTPDKSWDYNGTGTCSGY